MKKIILPFVSLSFLGLCLLSFASCTPEINDRLLYEADSDSIPPVISISVPANNQSESYGNHVAIVGTVTDFESAKNDIYIPGMRKGELSSVTIDVDDLTNNRKLLKRDLDVSGKDGISFNERVELITGSGITECRLIVVASDGAATKHTVRDTVDFAYQ
jgi:hypothetical protein